MRNNIFIAVDDYDPIWFDFVFVWFCILLCLVGMMMIWWNCVRYNFKLQANALRNQLQQIVDSYVNANDAVEYVNGDNEPAYDSIDMDALGMSPKTIPFYLLSLV